MYNKYKRLFSLSLITLLASVFIVSNASAVESDLDYLPANQNYDPAIPKPEAILGYPVGTWHVRHDQVVMYMQALAQASDRISLEVTGYTHEQRPLLLLTFTAAENQANVEQMRQAHLARLAKGEAAKAGDPLVLYMGYSVHGNEPSGTNAALLVAYHLAASQSDEVKALLAENVVLLDPSLNPDGLSRFAQWANMHKGYNMVADPNHREHKEHWPSGRTNHYWFDLNRDWLLLTHPESKARITQFHNWRPHILTDFHEMGTNSTFFFQPGIPSRKNPWTPDTNVTLTAALGDFHAQALDQAKELYFTEESFDDFYYGKGSTYPDAHGSIGILFEQASSRGHAQESINGLVEFPRTIQNQFTTSLSTFAGAMANKSAIAAYQRQFYRDTQALIKDDDLHGFIVKASKDATRFERMLSILKAHKVNYEVVTDSVSFDDVDFEENASIYVPLDQAQYRLIRSLFSERKRFVDNTFYDVSNWNIALAFNLDYHDVTQSERRKVKTIASEWDSQKTAQDIDSQAYAYVFEWHSANAPALLQSLLEKEVQVRVAGDGFTAKLNGATQAFAAGSIMIPTALSQPDDLTALLTQAQAEFGVAIHNVRSGLTPTGIDLGSRQFTPVKEPKLLLVGGVGTSSLEVGEIRHYLDTRIGLPATLVDLQNLGGLSLTGYTHIVFASGSYNSVDTKVTEGIETWVKQGGVLIGQKSALTWFAKNGWIDNEVLSSEAIDESFPTEDLQFKDRQDLAAKKRVAGAVFMTEIDRSHPMFFGFERDILPLFKTSNMVLESADNPFIEIANYTNKPLAAGYASDEIEELVSESAALVAKSTGRGVVIGFVDNVHFRGYWDGTNKLMANAIYMSPLL
jgi:hypothetical protein